MEERRKRERQEERQGKKEIDKVMRTSISNAREKKCLEIKGETFSHKKGDRHIGRDTKM